MELNGWIAELTLNGRTPLCPPQNLVGCLWIVEGSSTHHGACQHERRGGDLLWMAAKVPTGEKVEEICMEEALVYPAQRQDER